MRLLILFVLLLIAVNAKDDLATQEFSDIKDLRFDRKDAALFASGVFAGAFDLSRDFINCIKGVSDIKNNMNDAYYKLSVIETNSVRQGISSLGKALLNTLDLIEDWSGITTYKVKIKSIISRFLSPYQIMVSFFNILWGFRSISNLVYSITDSYSIGDWFNVGFNVGSIVKIAFIKTEKYQKLMNNLPADVVIGFSNGLNPSIFGETDQCILNISAEDMEKMASIVQDFKWGEKQDSIENMQKIVDFFVSLTRDCKDSSQEFRDYIQNFDSSLIQHDFKASALDYDSSNSEIYVMMQKIQSFYQEGEWFKAGEVIGDFYAEVLNLEKSPIQKAIKPSSEFH